MISTQQEKRVRRPRNVFSPSDNSSRPTHFLLYFDSTDSYNIALSSSINNITGNTATLNIHGKKTFATIITSGTLECCEKEQQKRTRKSQQTFNDSQREVLNSDEDEVIDMDLSSQQEPVFNTFSSSKRQSTTRSKQRVRFLSNDENGETIPDDDIYDEEDNLEVDHTSRSFDASNISCKSTTNKKKRKKNRTKTKNVKRQRKNVMDNSRKEDEQVNTCIAPIVIEETASKDMLNQIQNHIVLFQNHITKSLRKMEKKIDNHLGSNFSQGSNKLDQYRFDKDEIFPNEYMYKNINLLNTYSKDLVDFARKTLKILFSSEELKNHTLPPEREYLRRRALDPKRFDMMIEATRIKFRLDRDLMQQCFNDLLRTKLSNFLYEERRRELRKRLRDREHTLSQNVLQIQPNQLDHQETVDGEEEEEEGQEQIGYLVYSNVSN